jgi:ABC-type uncharacterized transport system substrate-binding protein
MASSNLNRPGGNVTGVSFISHELAAKQLGLLRELRPGAARIAVLVDPKWLLTEPFVSQVRTAASAMAQQIDVVYISSDRLPPDPKDDKALHTALDLMRHIQKNSACLDLQALPCP